MKLLTKYSRINIFSSVIIFVLASIAFYTLLHYVLLAQVDDDLNIEQHEIELYVQRFGKLPDPMPVRDQRISFQPAGEHNLKKAISNVTLNAEKPGEKERFRQLTFFIEANGQWHQVYVQKSLKDTEDIIRSIVIISLVTILTMLAAGFVINRLLLRKLWKPFYESLSLMKNFRLGQTKNVTFKETSIDEFKDLNETLQQSIKNAENEYQQLKEFTENASHELQTPLAVIRSKMDMLIQDEKLSESQSELVQSTYKALQKLSRLNQSLLLLNKIENRQFSETSNVNIKQLIEQMLISFKELLHIKNISVSAKLEGVIKKMNEALVDILLNNLFSNAIKYTPEGGQLNIVLNQTSMTFRNTSENGSLNTTKMFNRFYKGHPSTDNHGLGLSIAKQICLISGFEIEYKFFSGEHHFEVLFDPVHKN